MPVQALENAQPSTSDMTSGNRSDEGTTTDSHEKREKSKPGAAWKQNEVHEVPHKQAPLRLQPPNLDTKFVHQPIVIRIPWVSTYRIVWEIVSLTNPYRLMLTVFLAALDQTIGSSESPIKRLGLPY